MATFKEIYDDFKAGKKVRRTSWPNSAACLNPNDYDDGTEVSQLLADDWEVVEPTVTITRKQFDEVSKQVLNLLGGPIISVNEILSMVKTRLGL
jgi:hypothetical protein